MKNYTGQVEGFERIGAAQRKRDEEAAVLAWPREQGDDGKPALEAHDKLAALATDARATRERDLVVSRFDNTGVVDAALTLHRPAIEHEKRDAQRQAGDQDRDDARTAGALQPEWKRPRRKPRHQLPAPTPSYACKKKQHSYQP